MRIAVDVLGGDYAPVEVLRGVSAALKDDFSPDELLLVGPEDVIQSTLQAEGVELPPILHTHEVVDSHEKPVEALRKKRNSSISLCVGAVKEGKAGGLISFGNTGAAVAASTIGLGMLPGIRRPGIAVVFEWASGKVVLLDAGANPEPKASHLFHYGVMGTAYCRDMFGMEAPRIGLLNIGGEAGKGHSTVRDAHDLLEESSLNFVGNLEGQDLFKGSAEVLLTDGFVGNMLLKVVEGFMEYLLRGITGSVSDTESSNAMLATFKNLVGATDFAEVGGATLLGVNGVVLIGHGRSKSSAVAPALRNVRKDLRTGVNDHITEILQAHKSSAEA
ncbi:MAG: phosphate acyltransferase PlsX [Planctomycetota bacterium]|nr:phosphate acyltransferase PlsX [Planctomycetota bacterium]MDP6941736.1 phosphate acyltransferase PlsX [Planctomycetota bacterium]